MSAERTVVVWWPDWPVRAAGIDGDTTPVAVLFANRVVACSPAARVEGVKRGLRRREAQGRCPELVVLEHDPQQEARAFEPVVAVLDDVCPRIEVVRPGLVAFVARGPSRFFGGDEGVAKEVVRLYGADVRVGIADGRLAATLAARSARSWRVVPKGESRAYLARFPVGALEQPELADLLSRLGVRTLGALAELPPASVLARFGPEGATAARLARGLDERPLAARTPPPDFSASAELDPPAERVDVAAFVAKSLADRLTDELGRLGLGCTRLLIEAETEHGEHLTRLWRHDGALTAGAIAERVRWQLDGWLTGTSRAGRPTAGITLLRLVPDEVRPDPGRQGGFWGGTTLNDERASRALARVQGMLGVDAVGVAVVQGGRGPAERVKVVPFGDARERDRNVGGRSDAAGGDGGGPWPGAVPPPAPALVPTEPVPTDVLDAGGNEVRVTGRGLASAEPASVRGGEKVVGWAGPWPVDEKWWDPPAHRRRARMQVQTATGAAYLLAVEGGRWWIEAVYD